MFCKFCGTEIKEDAAFCQKCGKKTDLVEGHDTVKKQTLQEVFIPDVWIWYLAIIPLTITIALEKTGLITTLFGNASGSMANILIWVVPIVLNSFFIRKDDNVLTNLGFYSSNWFYIGVFLVPLYLIVREIKTNRNFVPSIIWVFILAVYLFIL